MRFAIDTGGTFTDIVVFDEETGRYSTDKVATTPHDTLSGVLAAIQKAKLDLKFVDGAFVHGSTTALNAMLERKGVKTAFLTTRGFRDIPEIMRLNRAEMYNPKYHKPPQIVPRELRFEITERVNARGEILVAIEEDDVRSFARLIRTAGVSAVAVCLLHSFRNPANEQRIKEILEQEYPDIPVAISSAVAPEHREFERGTTTILNAYLAPVVERWLGNLERELEKREFPGEILITRSDGGGMTADAAKRSPINMLFSGPAGGVIGATHLSAITGNPNIITLDVGGTSCDIASIRNGRAAVNQETLIGGLPILISNLDLRTIGAGCGSIAWIDSGGAIHVGPQSAGSLPGPVCYALGGSAPTVTDAFLVNGFIDATALLGGEMLLDANSARLAIEQQLATPLRMDLLHASSGVLRIVMNNMAEAVKDMLSEVGDDPRDFSLLCFGGGGPMFGTYLIEQLGMTTAIIPMVPATFSAFGMLMVDVQHDVVETVSCDLMHFPPDQLASKFAVLQTRANDLLRSERVPVDQRRFSWIAEIRYTGQEHTVSVPVHTDINGHLRQDALYQAFEALYKSTYGYALGDSAEVVNLRVRGLGELAKPTLGEIPAGGHSPDAALRGRRNVCDFLTLKSHAFDRYDRSELRSGNIIEGPALIEERTATTVVRPGYRCAVDSLGNLLISRA